MPPAGPPPRPATRRSRAATCTADATLGRATGGEHLGRLDAMTAPRRARDAPTGSLTRWTTLIPPAPFTREGVAPAGEDARVDRRHACGSAIGTPRASRMSPTDPPVARARDPRRPPARAEADPRSGLDDELRLLPRARGTTWSCPTRTVIGRRGRPAGAMDRRRASRAGPGSPPRVTTEVPSGTSAASSARSSRPSAQLVVRQRAERRRGSRPSRRRAG